MKKFTIIALSILLTAFIWTACKKDCKNCKTVTTDNTTGAVQQTGSSSQYCDTQLDSKENAEPVNDGSTTTKWVCE